MKRFLTTLLVMLSVAAGRAQAPLGLEEALRIARQNNLQLQKQQQRQKLADLEMAIKRGQLLPSLDLSASSSYTDKIAAFDLPISLPGVDPRIELGGHDRTDLAIGIRQPLFTGLRLRTQVNLAKTALESEASRLALLHQQTAAQVYVLFYQSQSLKKERRSQEASLKRLTVQLDQMRTLFENAQVMAYDTLQVYNQALQIKIQLEHNQRDQRLADLQMARLLDLPAVRPIVEIELAKPGASLRSPDSLKAMARRQRPELSVVHLGQHAAHLNQKLARGAYLPEIGAEAKYHYAKPGINQFADEWMDYATLGVSMQWNLWRGNQDRHRAQQAEVEYNRLALEERELLRNIDYEVEKSLENMKYAVTQIGLTEELLAQQQERYRIVTVQQREGVATTNDVLVAETDLTLAEQQWQRAIVQYHVSQTELLLAIGSLSE